MEDDADPPYDESVQFSWVRLDNGGGYRLETAAKITGSDSFATALIHLDYPSGGPGATVQVDVDGAHHSFPVSRPPRDVHGVHAMRALCIRALCIRVFTPSFFAVFVDVGDGGWPIGCFTRDVQGKFQCSVVHSGQPLVDLSAIGDRYVVLMETVINRRVMYAQCYDAHDTASPMWTATASPLCSTQYYMCETTLAGDADAGTVSLLLSYAGVPQLELTATEGGIVEAEGSAEWRWRLGADGDWRTDVLCTVKPVVAATPR